MAVRKGGRVSIPGVYGGLTDKFPLGAMMQKGLQMRTGPDPCAALHARAAAPDRRGRDRHDLPDQHRLPLEEAPEGYRNFRDNQNDWTKVVLRP
jgi:threonine dehydrogenase-like Zn-dependent dehydrogenase